MKTLPSVLRAVMLVTLVGGTVLGGLIFQER
jgi:hypothetical protein